MTLARAWVTAFAIGALFWAGVFLLLSGCATYTKLELKPQPPREHRGDLSVIVEYKVPCVAA